MPIGRLQLRQVEGQRRFFAALGAGSSGAHVLRPSPGVQATITPARPWYSIFNSVVFRRPEALPALTAAYAEAGCRAWCVWVPPRQAGTGEVLRDTGLTRDSTPMLMAAELAMLDLRPQQQLDLHPEPTPGLVAQVNDQAHGILPEWSMEAVFEAVDRGLVRPYVALVADAPAAALLAVEHGHDCYLWFVATTPKARRRALASELVRHALRQATARGCTTTTLESTAMAETMYAQLGYRPLGRYTTWEHRSL